MAVRGDDSGNDDGEERATEMPKEEGGVLRERERGG